MFKKYAFIINLIFFSMTNLTVAEGKIDMKETIKSSKGNIVGIVLKLDDEKFIFMGTGFFVDSDGYI